MSAASRTQHDQMAAAYEQYLRDHWDTLSAFEQEQARAYMHAKFSAAVAPKPSQAPGWTVPVGYVCAFLAILFVPIVLGPIAFGLGIYNTSKGRPGHGTALIVMSIVCTIIGFILGALAVM